MEGKRVRCPKGSCTGGNGGSVAGRQRNGKQINGQKGWRTDRLTEDKDGHEGTMG